MQDENFNVDYKILLSYMWRLGYALGYVLGCALGSSLGCDLTPMESIGKIPIITQNVVMFYPSFKPCQIISNLSLVQKAFVSSSSYSSNAYFISCAPLWHRHTSHPDGHPQRPWPAVKEEKSRAGDGRDMRAA